MTKPTQIPKEKVTIVGVKEHILRNDVAELIYSADWQIKGTLNEHTKDVTDHYMIDEDEVVNAIIKAIQEADRR